MRDNFTLAHTFTARWEGGLSDHEADPGGITNHGISLRWVTDLARQAKERCLRDARQCDTCPRRTGPDCDYFSLDLDNDGDIDADDIRACTKEQAARLFRRHFWEALGCDRLPLPLAVTLYDGAVNMGASRAVKQLHERHGRDPARPLLPHRRGRHHGPGHPRAGQRAGRRASGLVRGPEQPAPARRLLSPSGRVPPVHEGLPDGLNSTS